MQVAHREVQRQIIRYFYNGFLLEVFAAALQVIERLSVMVDVTL